MKNKIINGFDLDKEDLEFLNDYFKQNEFETQGLSYEENYYNWLEDCENTKPIFED